MALLARLLRLFAKARFRMLGLATIQDIPTDRFNRLVAELLEAGWRKVGEYDGFDAWIDYGRIRLRRGAVMLTLEWDNWTEGSIEGPHTVVEDLGRQFDLPVVYHWRSSDHDRPS